MRKKIVFLLCAVMILAMLAPAAVSADGMILWEDDFSSKDPANWLWDPPANLFDVENEKVEGWAECVVLQSNYTPSTGGTKRFKECAWKVEACALEDGGRDDDTHYLGVWWADYLNPAGDPNVDNDGQIVYEWGYDFEKGILQLTAAFDGAATAYEPASGYTRGEPVFTVEVPASEAPVMDPSGNGAFTVGLRISGGVISGFMNDKKYMDFNAYRGATTGTELGSPVLLVNRNCHCTFDNVVVATPDYNLFNESADAQQAVGNGGTSNNGQGAGNSGGSGGNSGNAGNGGTKTRIETTIDSEIVTHSRVIGVDENGNEITTIESEIVTVIGSREVADTDGSGSSAGRGGSATGDTAVIVIAVMIVALGSAIVVKKVSER